MNSLSVCMTFVLMCVGIDCMAMESVRGKNQPGLVIFEDNEFYQNNLAGIRVRGNTPVTIDSCRIYSNGRAGITVDKEAQLMVTACDVFQNGKAGINIEEAARITIEESRIYQNKMAGVRILRTGEKLTHTVDVKITNNRIYMNEQAGIRSMPQGKSEVHLAIVGNDIFQNQKAGVRVESNTQLTAKGNQIYENGTVGIVSSESVMPPTLDIYQNGIKFNHGPGIHVVNGVNGRIGIRNNWIFNNLRSGIACGLWGNPNVEQLNVKIINNTIVSNGSSGQGAGIRDFSIALAEGSNDQGAGIRNDSVGKVIIMNNIIAYNYVTGIITKRCRGYSYNLLFANGDVANCCDDTDSANYWIERRQFGGCVGTGKGDLIGAPLFVDPDNYNFDIQGESPAIDAGQAADAFNDVSFPPSKGSNRNDMGASGGPYAVRQG